MRFVNKAFLLHNIVENVKQLLIAPQLMKTAKYWKLKHIFGISNLIY